VVHWEQRGAGKSYSAALEKTGVTFDDCVDDVLAVTRLLLARYGKHKLFLIGHSWGSLIGVAAISRHPEYYDAYLGVGQIVNVVQQEKLSRKCALAYLAAHGPRADLNRLRSIGEPPYADALRSIALERKFLLRAGGVFGPGYSPGRMSWDLWTCPYYSLLDLWRLGKGASFCQSRLITSEHWDVRLDTTNTVFEIPVFFVMGDRDCNTPYVLARRYYERIRAPQKEFVTIEGAAHMLNFERPLRFNQEVVRLFSQVPR
jgi:pimeloyl-ACP methyl ester carboxylesterase